MEETLVIQDSCIGCGKCVSVCIRGHLKVLEDKKVHEVESPYYCFRCGHCAAICPKGAIRLKCDDGKGALGEIPSPDALNSLYMARRSLRWFDRNLTEDELKGLIESTGHSPTAENSQRVEYAVINERFPQFMELLASILRDHTDEHPRLAQFVKYVDDGQTGKNNPFTWEGRQLIVFFSRFPIDAIIAAEQLDLMAFASGFGGFHSRWMLLAAEKDQDRFMSFFPGISKDLSAFAVYVIGHPRMRFKRPVPRDERKTLWL